MQSSVDSFNQDRFVASLRGAPLSVLFCMMMYGGGGRAFFVEQSSYSINEVKDALVLLVDVGLVDRVNYRYWRLSTGAQQLDFKGLLFAERSVSDLSAKNLSTGSKLAVDNISERSLTDLSESELSTVSKLAVDNIPERSLTDLSGGDLSTVSHSSLYEEEEQPTINIYILWILDSFLISLPDTEVERLSRKSPKHVLGAMYQARSRLQKADGDEFKWRFRSLLVSTLTKNFTIPSPYRRAADCWIRMTPMERALYLQMEQEKEKYGQLFNNYSSIRLPDTKPLKVIQKLIRPIDIDAPSRRITLPHSIPDCDREGHVDGLGVVSYPPEPITEELYQLIRSTGRWRPKE